MEDTKKELAALADERAKRETAAAAEDAAEKIERDLRDERAIAKAFAEHDRKRLGYLKTDLGVVILKRPHHLHFRELTKKAELTEADTIGFVKKSLVHPTGAELETMLEELPALGGDLVSLVMKLARGRTEEVTGKS